MIVSEEKPQTARVTEISQALRLILEPGQVAELRSPGTRKGTVSGYFDDIEKMARAAAALSGRVEAVYVTLNPVDPALLARAANHIKEYAKHTTSDSNILRRRWLLIDLDAKRPAGISSTDEQHEAALARALKVRSWLSERGWPLPILADSGNGGHLPYRIDLPNDAESTKLVERVLKALAFQFDDETVEVDQTTFNAARISKIYGTMACKGDPTPDHPHRLARILESPELLEPVSRELLEELAAMLPEETKAATGQAHANGNGGGSFDLEAWIAKHGLDVIGPRSWGDSRKWIFPVCPWNPDHTNESAYLIRFPNGAITAGCHHNGCSGRDWHALRDLLEPGWRDARKGADRWDSSQNNCPATGGAPSKASGQVGQEAASTYFLSAPPFFPLEAFPQKYQGVIEEIAGALVVPVEVPAMALLTLAGACIGRTRAIQIKRGWLEHSNLYVGVVARSGLGKSPATRHIFKQVFALEKKWHAEYQKEALEFTLDSSRKKGKKDGEPALERPRWRQLIVDDATPEALTDALYSNPRGILWNRDELSGLILDLDKYAGKEGSTKTRLMSAYDSGLWKLNRVNASRCGFIPHATLSIFGTIQPDAMAMIFSKRDMATGFLPRFFFVRAEREAPALWTDQAVSQQSDKVLEDLVEKLLEYELLEDMPQIIKPSPSARMRYIEWFNQQSIEAWAGVDATTYDAVLAKLKGQCLRIALILHCMEAVASQTNELYPVSEKTMSNAIRLANCLKEHQKQAWEFVNSQAEELTPIQRRVARAIIDLEEEIQGGMLSTARITDRLNRGMEEKFYVKPEAVGKATASLGLISKHLPDKSARGIVLNPEDLARLRNILTPTVPTVRTVRG